MPLVFATTFFFGGGGVLRHSAVQTDFEFEISGSLLDTLSSDSSKEEIRDSGRSFQSLIVWEKKLYI